MILTILGMIKKKRKNVTTWIFVDQDRPFEAPGNMDAAVTLIQVGQLRSQLKQSEKKLQEKCNKYRKVVKQVICLNIFWMNVW